MHQKGGRTRLLVILVVPLAALALLLVRGVSAGAEGADEAIGPSPSTEYGSTPVVIEQQSEDTYDARIASANAAFSESTANAPSQADPYLVSLSQLVPLDVLLADLRRAGEVGKGTVYLLLSAEDVDLPGVAAFQMKELANRGPDAASYANTRAIGALDSRERVITAALEAGDPEVDVSVLMKQLEEVAQIRERLLTAGPQAFAFSCVCQAESIVQLEASGLPILVVEADLGQSPLQPR